MNFINLKLKFYHMITLNDSYRKLNIETDSKRDYFIDINIKSNKFK